MRKGTQKVLKNKNLHVGLMWLLSNLESVAGASTEEANSKGSDSWQWIWLICTIVGALSLIEAAAVLAKGDLHDLELHQGRLQ